MSTEDLIVYSRLDAVEVALGREEFDRAGALIADIREFDGPCARLLFLEGRLQHLSGNAESARQLLERSSALEPEAEATRQELARVHLALGLTQPIHDLTEEIISA